jgi:hypothetical protein
MIHQAQPGDIIRIQGVVLPKKRTKDGFSNELLFTTFIYVTKIIK